jgi:SAM-dependent methyltransferase
MKIRESDMPKEEEWAQLFNPNTVLKLLGVDSNVNNVADFGCGYGTFVIPAAQVISGTAFALDIEPEMVKTVERKAKELRLNNVVAVLRDFMSDGSGLASSSIDFVFLFNILHTEDPILILKEAYRILKLGGKVGIVHWTYNEKFRDDPCMKMIPSPEQCIRWADSVGFRFQKQFELKPCHFGIVMKK